MFTKEECYAVQKFIGWMLAIVAFLSIFIEWDVTVAVMFVPLGLYVAYTKEIVISVDYEDETENGKS